MDSKLKNFIFIISLFCFFIAEQLSFAQAYECKIFQQCKTEDSTNQTLLYTRFSTTQNNLVKEIEHNTLDSSNNTIRIFQYNQEQQITYTIDSNKFQKTNTQYIYDKNILKEKIIISSILSTENITQKSKDPLTDSILEQQPKIIYVKIIDTSSQKYYYTKDGLVEKIIQAYKNDFTQRTEFFEYNKLKQLIKTTYSDIYQYRYFYNEKGKLVKKEKYENRYIDDSSIGPYFKAESERLKKAIWELVATYEMNYNSKGNIIAQITTNTIGYPTKTRETYRYDEKNRLVESTLIENNNISHCSSLYYYFPTP